MIVVYHTKGAVDAIVSDKEMAIDSIRGSMTNALFEVAAAYPSAGIVWCETQYKDQLDIVKIKAILSSANVMVSCSARQQSYLDKGIHYVEETPFMKLGYKVKYPTWLMSTDAGGIHAQVLNQLGKQDFKGDDFGYTLNAIAKSCQPQGLFCYQVSLLTDPISFVTVNDPHKSDPSVLYRFVKQHYKSKWIFFLFMCQVVFEKKWNLKALLSSFFVSKKRHIYKVPVLLEGISKEASNIDVIIPTMGRAIYLHDVLRDLARQTHLPENVVIVEQNEDPSSSSELDFIKDQSWPFNIVHRFVHQTGACNARNIALSHTTSEWIFFADDDIRFESDLLQNGLKALVDLNVQCIAMSCLQKGEKKTFTKIVQWSSFPSGAAIVSGTLSRKLNFNTSYEHGYGEDTDYGMQLRNEGVDIIYHPDVELLHLKAPVGGFRKRVVQPWEREGDRPKPSPTVMLYRLKHTSKLQLQGYKLRLFLRQLKRVPLSKKLSYRNTFNNQWTASVKWAKYLDKQ